MLTVELENAETSERWSAEFTSQSKLANALHTQHIVFHSPTAPFTTSDLEEITHKSGNLKRAPIFMKMLCSAFAKDNESVTVDVLTYTDLEMIKAQKRGASGVAVRSSAASAPARLAVRHGRAAPA